MGAAEAAEGRARNAGREAPPPLPSAAAAADRLTAPPGTTRYLPSSSLSFRSFFSAEQTLEIFRKAAAGETTAEEAVAALAAPAEPGRPPLADLAWLVWTECAETWETAKNNIVSTSRAAKADDETKRSGADAGGETEADEADGSRSAAAAAARAAAAAPPRLAAVFHLLMKTGKVSKREAMLTQERELLALLPGALPAGLPASAPPPAAPSAADVPSAPSWTPPAVSDKAAAAWSRLETQARRATCPPPSPAHFAPPTPRIAPSWPPSRSLSLSLSLSLSQTQQSRAYYKNRLRLLAPVGSGP